jgi:hydrogenase expression/formation protein HypD
MENLGGQTHAPCSTVLTTFSPKKSNWVHGPGCPVCVTPLELIDKGIAIAQQRMSFLPVMGYAARSRFNPGSSFRSAAGGKVKIVTSPIEVLQIARSNPDQQVVFFAIGFETTAPANALSVLKAKELNLKIIPCWFPKCRSPGHPHHLSDPQNRVQGFLAAGHVCSSWVSGIPPWLRNSVFPSW